MEDISAVRPVVATPMLERLTLDPTAQLEFVAAAR
jgi:hypothetical protein